MRGTRDGSLWDKPRQKVLEAGVSGAVHREEAIK